MISSSDTVLELPTSVGGCDPQTWLAHGSGGATSWSHCEQCMVPALINAQIIFSYLWLLYGDVHMEAIHHWD